MCVSHEHGYVRTVVVPSPNIPSTYFRLGKIFNTPSLPPSLPADSSSQRRGIATLKNSLSKRTSNLRILAFEYAPFRPKINRIGRIACIITLSWRRLISWRGGVHLARNLEGKELGETGHGVGPELIYSRSKLGGPKLN